ncbi:MAG: hypothetical protein U5K76_10995 [Woeseiaceae bacterium]|nr:hypothetical protein [Woeseiaceae bacterium]
MLFTDVIRVKRDGGELSGEQIGLLVAGLADGSLPAEQVAALAMAIFLNSMTFDEAGLLTLAMARSGTVLDWQDAGLDGPVVDRRSTGGVGDKVSFLLAPVVAACGGCVPMISRTRTRPYRWNDRQGRGGIPGYDATPDFDRFRKVVRETGCAIIGQTAELAPADRRFYAIRDITGTVESVPLITRRYWPENRRRTGWAGHGRQGRQRCLYGDAGAAPRLSPHRSCRQRRAPGCRRTRCSPT